MGAVVFRRINGHVIPIRARSSEGADANRRNNGKAAALIGAGVATGYASGKISAGIMHESAHAENAARGAKDLAKKQIREGAQKGPLFEHAARNEAKTANKFARESLKNSRELEKGAFRLRNAGAIAAGGLIGAGVHKALSQGKQKENTKTNAAIAAGSGAAAGFAVHYGYGRGVAKRGFKALRHAARRAFMKA